MKNLFIVLFVLIGFVSKAQYPSQQNPTQFSTGWFKQGWNQSDSGHILSNRIPNFTPRFSGTIILYQQAGVDSSIYYYNGGRWLKLSQFDSTSLINKINLKLNIIDTVNKWWGVGKRWVDTVYRVNDSTIGLTINDGTQQTFQILGRSASGGGSGTVTSVGLSMPSAFTVSTPNPITTSGVFNITMPGLSTQYVRANGTVAPTDTGMIPDFYSKVRSLFTGVSPITLTNGNIGILPANTTGQKGAATFNNSDFTDNGSGLISLRNPSGQSGVDTIYRTQGVDSIYFTINSIIYAIKDSIGSVITANNGLTKTSNTIQLGATTATGAPLLHNTFIDHNGSNFRIYDGASDVTLKLDVQSASWQLGKNNINGAYLSLDSGSHQFNLQAGNAAYINMDASVNDFKVIMQSGFAFLDLDADNGSHKIGDISSFGSGNQTYFNVDDANSRFSFNTGGARKALLASNGQWIWDGYPSLTAQVDTTTYKPVGIDGSGNVVKMAGWAGAGGGGGGITSFGPIGSTPNANGASISGSTATLQPTNGVYGGVINTDTQTVKGSKAFISKHNTIQGLSVKLNAQTIPSTIASDSLYESGKYLGFGFIDMFASGTIVQCFIHSDDHVGNNGYLQMRRSYDQGRTWTTSTIDTGSTGYYISGLSGGVTHTNRLIVFLQRINSSGLSFIDQRIMYSDDEGATFSAQQVVSHNSETNFQPYGPLCKIAGDSLLLSWYGSTGSAYSSYVIKSGDDGLTWSSPIPIVSNTTGQFTETSVMYLGGRTLIALARSEITDSAYAQFISNDNGSTWTKQGVTPFGQSGTPAWTKAFKSKNGKRGVVAYYRRGPYESAIKACYAWADSVVLGPQYWRIVEEKTIIPVMHGSGYFQACHPYDDENAIGTYYDETVFVEDATIKYKMLPVGENRFGDKFIDVSGGINYYQGGYVGFGASVPESKVDIRGIELKSGAEETPLIIGSADASGRLAMSFGLLNNATSGNRGAYIDVRQFGVGFNNLSLLPDGGGFIGLKIRVPLSPLHLNATTTNYTYTTRIIDNNSTIGTHFILGNTALSTNKKYKAFFVNNDGLNIGSIDDASLGSAGATAIVTVDNSTFGRIGIGVTSPDASLHLKAGTTFNGTAPLAIDSGALMTIPVPGKMEYNGHWWVTDRTGLRTQFDGANWTGVTGGINYAGGFVGIGNAAPSVRLDVKGANTKTGSAETVGIFGSSDASQALNLFVDVGNNATAGSRYLSLQGVESGVAFRPLSLQPSGGNVLIGSFSDNGVGKLQVNGKLTVATHTIGSNSDSAVVWDRSTNEYKYAAINSSATTTIYNGDGTLASDRNVSSGGFTLRLAGANNSDTLLSVANAGTSGIGAYMYGTLRAIDAQSTTLGALIFGTSQGIQTKSTNGEGIFAQSDGTRAAKLVTNLAATNTVDEVLNIQRAVNSGLGANGIGAAITMSAENTSGAQVTTAQMIGKFTTATAGSEVSELSFIGVNNSSTNTILTIAGDGSATTYGRRYIATVTSSAGTLTLGNAEAYIFNGTTTTWTLPAVSGTNGLIYYIKNIGSGSITLNANGGSNEIYSTSAVNTITVPSNSALVLISNGTYFTTNP